ncbi:MAG: hypothetical protein NTZ07_03135 [Candidatus Woesebacteria bacterium]|nr:hypothetical protein [Candidatus Woesebacteria bacterium]
MNKWLFYLVMAVLVLTGIICLIIGAVDNKPTEFVAVLVASIVLSNLFLTIVKGGNLLIFVGLLSLTALGALIMIILNVWNYILTYGLTEFPSSVNPIVYGIRFISMAWPSAVLVIGIKHYYDESQKEKAKQDKSKKQAPKAEQQKL